MGSTLQVVTDSVQGIEVSAEAQAEMAESLKDTFFQLGDIHVRVNVVIQMNETSSGEVKETVFKVTHVPQLYVPYVECALRGLLCLISRQSLRSGTQKAVA